MSQIYANLAVNSDVSRQISLEWALSLRWKARATHGQSFRIFRRNRWAQVLDDESPERRCLICAVFALNGRNHGTRIHFQKTASLNMI